MRGSVCAQITLQCSGSASRLVGLLRYWGWLDSKTVVAGLPSSVRHLVSNNGKHFEHNYSFGTPKKQALLKNYEVWLSLEVFFIVTKIRLDGCGPFRHNN
jgi:hypothetical protein